MEASNNGEEIVLQDLKVAEALVDKMLTEPDAIRELTGKNARLDNILDNVLSTFWQRHHAEMLKRRRETLQEYSKKMGRPRRSKSV